VTEAELRQHLRATHFMRGVGVDWPAGRMERAHTFAHRHVTRPDHQHA